MGLCVSKSAVAAAASEPSLAASADAAHFAGAGGGGSGARAELTVLAGAGSAAAVAYGNTPVLTGASAGPLPPPSSGGAAPASGPAPDVLVAAALRHARHAVTIYGESSGDGAAALPAAVPKPDSVRELILAALKGSVFFGDFSFDELTGLADAMELRSVPAATVVIRQGEPGDNFYVIERGRVRRRRGLLGGAPRARAPRVRSSRRRRPLSSLSLSLVRPLLPPRCSLRSSSTTARLRTGATARRGAPLASWRCCTTSRAPRRCARRATAWCG